MTVNGDEDLSINEDDLKSETSEDSCDSVQNASLAQKVAIYSNFVRRTSIADLFES